MLTTLAPWAFDMHREGECRDVLPGVHARLVHESLADGLWVIYLRLEPGTQLAAHAHKASVHFLTTKGAWLWRHEDGAVTLPGQYVQLPPGQMPAIETEGGVELFLHITDRPDARVGKDDDVVTPFPGTGWTDRLLHAVRRPG